jgi:FlaA1/EpsC-like NDP-sugar epimerase/lipopolysaccharide/colanic/teichoic acid biosynthesis glycosyltransferase
MRRSVYGFRLAIPKEQMKRLFDLVVSGVGLLFLSPLIAAVAAAIRLDSPGPVFYRGERVGRGGRKFRIFKFRTMVADASLRGGGLTYRDDPRITRMGSLLRTTKIDELPQLVNVFKGEMSLVGPRPEDPRYVALYTERQRQVLSLRPGVTSVASLRYRQEEELLPPDRWEQAYISTVLPAKLDLELSYLAKSSFGQDLLIMAGTLLTLLRDAAHVVPLAPVIRRIRVLVERYVSWAIIDAVLVVIAYSLAILIRSLDAQVDVRLASQEALFGVLIYLAANYVFGIYRRAWRYASGQESVVLFLAVMTATGVLFAFGLTQGTRDLPLGAVIIGGIFTFMLMAGVRYRGRLLKGVGDTLLSLSSMTSSEGARVLIVGAGEEGQLLAWQLQNRTPGKGYQVLGFVDQDRGKHGMLIHNLPVYGNRSLIPELVKRLHVDLIIIAIPPQEVHEPRVLLAICRSTQAQVKILPGLSNLLRVNGTGPVWVDADEDELLQRQRYRVDAEACSRLIRGKIVMITGAAGSIGSELSRQLAAFGPARLAIVDIDESGLYELQVELLAKQRDLALELALCDITDRCGVEALFSRIHPQIVFHVAAYKHVPILEEQPREGIRVNISGTKLMHCTSQTFGVERFILISSDKAVNPTSVLGMTKRLGELLVSAPRRSSAMLSTAVRFGNVLGSRGSVIPTFEKQIDLGGPITITDPEMTRYFLSTGEAVSLIIQAVSMTSGGDIYVLEMGVPVKIVDLAHRLIRVRGLRPGQDIGIEYVGVRPGEKMSEELVGLGETLVPTEHPSIYRIRQTAPLDLEAIECRVDELMNLNTNGTSADALRAQLRHCLESVEPGAGGNGSGINLTSDEAVGG